MQKIIALIGTSHQFQFGGRHRTSIQNDEFEAFLTSTCLSLKARLLAEEMSEDALNENDCQRSTVAALALNLQISHAYCDPSVAEQIAMKLCVERSPDVFKQCHGWSDEEVETAIANEHKVREKFWLDRLCERNVWPVVFVCGSKHVKSFQELLHTNGLTVHLIEENWGDENQTQMVQTS